MSQFRAFRELRDSMSELIYGLLGRTLGHSWSVPIHRALGCDSYRLIELEPEDIGSFLMQENIGGLNVTIPYKRDVMRYCGIISPEAEVIGSVNTIIRDGNGKLVGHNTDYFGLKYMADLAGIDFCGAKTVVFGSGGASLTAQYAAKTSGADTIVVVSRNGNNNYDNLSLHYYADIIINATPLGMFPKVGVMPADPSLFPNCRGVFDMIYNPCRTALIMRAQKLKIPCSGGLPMLVAQAVKSEELFYKKRFSSYITSSILQDMRRNMQNIVLIGMPGSGKSAVGMALSRLTGRTLIDIDERIVKKAGISIAEIFSASGEENFRQMERDEVFRAGLENGVIIVTGGGVVKDARNYAPLRQNGRIYHIERNLSALPRDGRPLSENADLTIMYRNRIPMYEHFRDCAVYNCGTIESTADKIWRDFIENTCD